MSLQMQALDRHIARIARLRIVTYCLQCCCTFVQLDFCGTFYFTAL